MKTWMHCKYYYHAEHTYIHAHVLAISVCMAMTPADISQKTQSQRNDSQKKTRCGGDF